MKSLLMLSHLLSAVALADITPTLGEPHLAGSGCPRDNSTNEVSITEGTIDFKTNLQLTPTEAQFSRLNCTLAIPVTVPQGKMLIALVGDVYGSARTGKNTQAGIRSETFLQGQDKQIRTIAELKVGTDKKERRYRAPSKPKSVSSACGQSVTFRVNQSVILRATKGNADGRVILESQRFKLSLKDCRKL